jgi:class 3 adenylate cyclase
MKPMAPSVTPLFSEPETPDPTDRKWLSGNEVLQETGISKRDLIRFIQLRVLPKTMMRVSASKGHSRKKSYFSADILGHVSLLKRLRDQGHSIEEIAREMHEAAEGSDTPHPPPTPKSPADDPPVDTTGQEGIPPQIHLLVDSIATAAFFVTPDLRIGWIKAGQGDRLSVAIENELSNDPAGTVLDIMLRASLKEMVFNWPPLFSFTYRFLQATVPAETFEKMAPMVSLNLEETDSPESFIPGGGTNGPVDSCPIRLENEGGQIQLLRFYGIALSEGTLFILDEDRWQEPLPVVRMEDSQEKPASKDDLDSRKIPFSVLSARLDESRSIVDTLLPETYFKLMTRIWDESDRVLAFYGGQRAKRSGTEVQYIIPKHANTDPAFDAIRCAFALKEKMREIEDSLKADGGWFANIRLNIGVSSGSDHVQPEDLTASMAFLLPGGASDQAFHLSAIAHGGGIWITKSAFGHLSPRQRDRIVFGIYRDDKLIRNIFAQVEDLPHAPDTPPLARAIRSLSVTRIIDFK